MTTATAERPIQNVLADADAADAALAEHERLAAEAAALKTAAKPATKRELQAAAESARKLVEARRVAAVTEYELATNTTWLATENVAQAAHEHAEACRAAHHERLNLTRLRRAVEDAFGVATARENYDRESTVENRQALIAASDAVQRAMADCPPVPAPYSHRAASRAPGVAAGIKADRDALALPV